MSYDAPPPPQAPYGGPPAAAGNSSKAVWALVCAIVGLLICPIVLGVVAIVLGRQAQREGRPGGIAKAAEIIGYVDIALAIVEILDLVSR